MRKGSDARTDRALKKKLVGTPVGGYIKDMNKDNLVKLTDRRGNSLYMSADLEVSGVSVKSSEVIEGRWVNCPDYTEIDTSRGLMNVSESPDEVVSAINRVLNKRHSDKLAKMQIEQKRENDLWNIEKGWVMVEKTSSGNCMKSAGSGG